MSPAAAMATVPAASTSQASLPVAVSKTIRPAGPTPVSGTGTGIGGHAGGAGALVVADRTTVVETDDGVVVVLAGSSDALVAVGDVVRSA
jgi:hypothetical protein